MIILEYTRIYSLIVANETFHTNRSQFFFPEFNPFEIRDMFMRDAIEILGLRSQVLKLGSRLSKTERLCMH